MPSGAVVDTSELDRELGAIERRVTDYSPITPVLAEILVSAVNDRWQSGGNGQWPPLAASTLYKRRLHGKGAQILPVDVTCRSFRCSPHWAHPGG